MDRTSSFGYATNASGQRVFVDENLSAGIDGTDWMAADATAHQEEIMGIIEILGGMAGSAANLKQAAAAIQAYVAQTAPSVPPTLVTASGNIIVPANKYWGWVRAIGGGGGGAGCNSATTGGGGGGSGGYSEGWMSFIPGASVPVVIGAGGAGGGPAVSGGAGGTTSIGAIICTGGSGGVYGGSFSAGGQGGTSTGGYYNPNGSTGGDGLGGGYVFPGYGGNGAFGGGGRGATTSSGVGGSMPGAGGGGCYSQVGGSGGNGAAGIVIIHWK